MSRLEDIRARLDAATPGPWALDDGHQSWSPEPGRAVVYQPLEADETNRWGHVVGVSGYRTGDVALIAHAPQDIADLLAVARAAQEVLAQWDIGEIEDSAGVLDALDDTFARLDGDAS